jgi:hypothetical protein
LTSGEPPWGWQRQSGGGAVGLMGSWFAISIATERLPVPPLAFAAVTVRR